jgi:DNA replication protein DnaC
MQAVQQFTQFGECGRRRQSRPNGNVGTLRRVGNPRREPAYGAVGQLAENVLTRVRNRWTRYDLIVIDELGYVVMPDAAAELLFQIIAGRAERSAVIVTTNLPFSEWTTKCPNARLCKAMLDRLTDQANIIETGDESYRFRRTVAKKGGKA